MSEIDKEDSLHAEAVPLNSEKWKTHPISNFKSQIVEYKKVKEFSGPVKSFYKNQNALINDLIDVSEAVTSTENLTKSVDHCHREKRVSLKVEGKVDEILAKGVFAVNCVLMIAKSVASGISGSLSVISSLVDSVTDLLSGMLMWWTSRRMKRFNPYLYPEGRRRLEPISIIILSVIMSVASFQLIRESVVTIISMATDNKKPPNMDNISICIVASTIVLKAILWILCKILGKTESSAALLQDSRNDVISNTVVLLCSTLSSRLHVKNVKYLDPVGAIIIAVYIIYGWFRTGSDHVRALSGHTASAEFLQKITFIALNHNPNVRYLETVRAFHFGTNYLVEVDIVLDEHMKLRDAHDIGESLQKKIETLEEVERCFVHIDYDFDHDPRREHKLV